MNILRCAYTVTPDTEYREVHITLNTEYRQVNTRMQITLAKHWIQGHFTLNTEKCI